MQKVHNDPVSVKRYRINHPAKYVAHRILWNAIRSGKIKKGKCKVCGCEKVEGHHHDYTDPLDVTWLCRKHHKGFHAFEKKFGAGKKFVDCLSWYSRVQRNLKRRIA